MEIIARTKSVRVSPRKVRLVADAIRSQSAENALKALAVINKRGGYVLEKTLSSAIANAINNANTKKDALFIKSIDVTEGISFKRFHPSTRGRAHPYKKRGSNITIVLEERNS
jgi:large subunit ribosomal protein L22